MTSWILYLRRRRARLRAASSTSSPPTVSTPGLARDGFSLGIHGLAIVAVLAVLLFPLGGEFRLELGRDFAAHLIGTLVIVDVREEIFLHGLGLQRGLFGQQGLAVCDRDLVVIGMDFAERQETVAVSTVVYEGGLERRFDPRDFREVDVPLKLLFRCAFVVEIFETASVEHNHPRLFQVAGIDQHAFCH